MGKYIFLFDLDATLTTQEILPAIAKKAGVYEKMCALTGAAVQGEIPFKQSFLKKVELLKEIPVSEVSRMVLEIPLNEKLVDFMGRYHDRCYIVTDNPDVWIENLMKKIGMEKKVFCSKASVNDDRIQDIFSIIDKNAVIGQMLLPFVAVGGGNNDAEMIEGAEIGIGYGGVRDIASSVLACATHAVYEEDKLVDFLERLV